MSGYANFQNLIISGARRVPCLRATPENIGDLGRMIRLSEFRNLPVSYENLNDPLTKRPLIIPRAEAKGKFQVWREGNFSLAENHAVGSGLYKVAKIVDSDEFYFREVNFHPESSQIIFPEERKEFILILGREPTTLAAYVFDGEYGFNINPRVWHQPPIVPFSKLVFDNKQAESHICVVYDSVDENDEWMYFKKEI